MHIVELTPTSQKELLSLPIKEQKKVKKRIQYLREGILVGKKLEGEFQGYYTLRAWPYRILYTLIKNKIWIIQIIHRQGAYK